LIVFQSDQDPNNPQPAGPAIFAGNVWVVAADGSQAPIPLTTVTASGAFSQFPFWEPDGSLIVFDSTRDPNPLVNGAGSVTNTWVVKPDGSGELPLTNLTAPAFANDPVNLD